MKHFIKILSPIDLKLVQQIKIYSVEINSVQTNKHGNYLRFFFYSERNSEIINNDQFSYLLFIKCKVLIFKIYLTVIYFQKSIIIIKNQF